MPQSAAAVPAALLPRATRSGCRTNRRPSSQTSAHDRGARQCRFSGNRLAGAVGAIDYDENIVASSYAIAEDAEKGTWSSTKRARQLDLPAVRSCNGIDRFKLRLRTPTATSSSKSSP
jgi:hypothetical protein